ncbi:MAG TPA: hypothetical protein VGG19_08895 [Tepidisphaeraceae bacterium]
MNHLIEYVVIGCYLTFLIVIGSAFHRFNKNVSDYFRSGCRGTWWLVGASVFMGGITAYSFTGSAGVAFEAGWAVAIIYIGNSLGYFVNFLFMAGWFRQLRATTSPEVIRMRFGPVTQQLYAFTGVILGIVGAAITLWAVAIFSASVFGYRIDVIIVILGCVGLTYSLMGGIWGVMATDFVQGLILMPMTILITVLCLHQVGGVSGFFHMVQQKGLSHQFAVFHPYGEFKYGYYTVIWAAAMIFKQTLDQNTLGAANRYFSVKDGKEARKAALIAVIMMLAGAIFWFIPPMTARMLYEKQTLSAHLNNPAESAFAVAAMHVLPSGLIGLMAVAMFSATLSTIDTGLNRNAAVAMKDIYPLICRIFRRPLDSDRVQLMMSRLITMFFGLCIISNALYFSRRSGMGMFDITLNLGAMLGLPLATPLLLGLFIRKVPSWSAIFSIVCGFACSAVAYYSTNTWTYQQKVFLNVLAGSVSFLATMPFWRYAPLAYREQVVAFFTRMHTPVDFEKEVGAANDTQQLKMIGGFSVAIAIFICLLLLIPNNLTGRLSILFIGGVVMIVGLAMRWAARNRQLKEFAIIAESQLINLSTNGIKSL